MSDSLQFGTSGLRGLATDLSGAAARRYTAAFLGHLRAKGWLGGAVYLARDLRASSPGIAADCAAAIAGAGLRAVDCGELPTPALALHAMAMNAPAIMVTGSHIPGDRNGLKFYVPAGEISKQDEQGISAALPAGDAPARDDKAEDGFAAAGDRYRQRYRHFLAADALAGWRVGVFEHSSVARDILVSMLTRARAEVVRLGRSTEFVAVDTEAFGDAVFAPRKQWIADQHLDAIVSTDGDGDRPLIIDAGGEFVRGDAIGLITAQFVGAQTVVTPVTSNSAIEGAGGFRFVQRTKVGSPFVIAGMTAMAQRGGVVVGFEANGGVLLATDAEVNGRNVTALPTRDALLPILSVLGTAAGDGLTLAQLVQKLPLRAALADRLSEVATDKSAGFVRKLMDKNFAAQFFAPVGEVESVSTIDGPRFSLVSGDTVHYRASGNAPELRCYVEGVTPERAEELLRWGLDAAAKIVRG